ncbi:hypothetical protein JG688_00014908 [Phytophthora aleatoria]|uniref:Ubiquitin-like domain-containing protein n=1 Tax=Phytophthora aleatoria TaxID=2496075 RepID=A0A8J5IWG6_9STRA|nr:hypothetical protein JG688_00014908 [Phytophthora aleatoria]
MSTLPFPILWKDVHERGISGVIELHMSDLPLKGARVGDLFPVLNTKINAMFPFESNLREVESFLLYGKRVSRGRTLEPLIPELGSSPRFVAIMRVYPRRVPRASIKIFIKTLTSKNILIHCENTNTVAYLKSKIRDKEKIALDHQILIFAWKQLEDHLPLCSYGIKNQSQVHLVRPMRGGGVPSRIFADVSDDSLLTELEFSHDGPEWRWAYNGLNIEGRCKNATCDAFQERIIHPKRFEAFNLMQDDGIQCPMCFAKVKPRTCGFYDCAWKFEGVQERDGYTIISQWKDACGHKYHRFNAGKNCGSAEWESLLIVAKPREGLTAVKLSPTAQSAGINKTDKCTICWSEFGSTASVFIVTVGCGHSFHCACIDKWSGWCAKSDSLPSCPVCRREVQAPGRAY